jgi:ankyrin repeat protein
VNGLYKKITTKGDFMCINLVSHSKFLAAVDKVGDYIPFVSTITNLVDLFQKAMLDLNKTEITEDQHYYVHLKKKDYVFCAILLIPVFGNIMMAYMDLQRRFCPSILDIHLNILERGLEINKERVKRKINELAEQASEQSGNKVIPEQIRLPEGEQRELSQAIESENLQKVSSLIHAGADPNFEAYGRSQFMRACQMGSLEIVKLLLPKIPDINALDKFGDSCLMHACKSGNEELVKYLLGNGADPSIKKLNGYQALFAAIEGKNIVIFDFLLQRNGDASPKGISELRDNHQNTVLAYASDIETTKALLNRLGDHKQEVINAKNPNGLTILHTVLLDSKLEVAEFLFESGADPFINGVDQSFTSFRYGFTIDGKTTPFMIACKKGHTDFVKKVLQKLQMENDEDKKKGLFNAQTTSKSTVLHIALEKSKLDIAELLLDAGADPLISRGGEILYGKDTPLMIACQQGHSNFVVKVLEKFKLDEDTERGLLKTCANHRYLDLLEILLKKTVLPKGDPCFDHVLCVCCGETAKEKQAQRNRLVEILLSKEANVNFNNVSRRSRRCCLVEACSNEDLDLIEWLLKNGANADQGDEPWELPVFRMPYSIGKYKNQEEFERYLRILERLLSSTAREKLLKRDETGRTLKESFKCRASWPLSSQPERYKQLMNLIDKYTL